MATNTRQEWHRRIKDVELEFVAARLAVDALIAALDRGTVTLPAGAKVRDVRRMSENLEGTFFIRLFAAFESGLRSYWETVRDTVPPSRDVIDAIAARRRIDDGTRLLVHTVRGYRNSLVHEGEEASDPIPLATARGHLQQFFGWLPPEW